MKLHRNQSTSFLMLLLLRLQSRKSRSSGGYTLVITIAVLLVLSVLLITYAITSKVDNISSTASAKSNTGFYSAEAGLNRRAERIRAKFVGYNLPTGMPPKDASGYTTWKACVKPGGTPGSGDFQCETDTNIGPQPVSTYVEDLTLGVPSSIVIPPGELYSGLSAQEYRYNVLSIAQDRQTQPTAILGMQFKSRLIPLFQFAAFYNQDMDFFKPPEMYLNGSVHSNNDLYLNASSSGASLLSIKGQVTTAGKLYRGEKGQNICSGTVEIDDATSTARSLGPAPCSGNRTEFDTAAVAPWNGKIRVGVQSLKPPPPDDFDATPGKLYWKSADLRIALDLTSSTPAIQVRSSGDTLLGSETDALLNSSTCAPTQTKTVTTTPTTLTVTPGTGTNFAPNDRLTVGADPNLYFIQSVSSNSITLTTSLSTSFSTPAAGTIVRKPIVSFSDKTFRNYREKRGNNGTGRNDYTPIQMLNVDIRGLLGCAKTLMGGLPLSEDSDGGLVWFLTVKGPNSTLTNDYGIRIYNGRDLVSPVGSEVLKGLSIISDQAVYVQGDYNCGTACSQASFSDPVNVSQRKPAAVMADSINVLSNAWPPDDSWSNLLISTTQGSPIPNEGRPASETTINAAFLAGIDITGGVSGGGRDKNDATGGGLNNYPRFHEDWSNANLDPTTFIPFNYQGSLVSLSEPRHVNGKYCGSGSTGDCNIYNPPKRNWRYDDTQFNNAANLPPISPRTVFLKQELFSRNFEQVSRPMPTFWAMLSPRHWLGVLTTLMQPHR
jgi:hypothetical protein